MFLKKFSDENLPKMENFCFADRLRGKQKHDRFFFEVDKEKKVDYDKMPDIELY